MYTLGIPDKQKRRTLNYLSNQYPSKMGKYIDYEISPSNDGFFQLSFPGMNEDQFRDIVIKLKREGISTIGADTQLTESKIMKLINLVPLKESLQVTTNNGKVAIVSDPEDIKTFYKGGTVFGDDSDGDSIELSKETSLDFKSITQEGSCGYAPKGEDPNKADQPAGPHLLRKKIREIIKEMDRDNDPKTTTGMEDLESSTSKSQEAEQILMALAKSFGDISLDRVVNDSTYKSQAITQILLAMSSAGLSRL
jgi:hypothetical protein